jgi:hypothetical protein
MPKRYFFALGVSVLSVTGAFLISPTNTKPFRCVNPSNSSVAMSSSSSCSAASNRNGAKNKVKGAMYPFSEARKIARGHGFSSKQEFLDYDCPGAYQLPKNPDEVWPESWRGWDDFLGIILEWEEGRQVARSLNVDSEEAYLELFREKKIQDDDVASRLPYRPDLKYKDRWVSWEDYLNHPSE